MATTVSFQGVSSGLQTDNLVNAIIQQEGQSVQRFKDKQALNTKRIDAFTGMKNAMIGLSASTTGISASQDKASLTSSMQDIVSKFNATVKIYKDASTATKNSDGSVTQAAFSNDPTARSFISQVRSALGESSAKDLGIKTNRDGTLSLDLITLNATFDKDPEAARGIAANLSKSVQSTVTRLTTYDGNIPNTIASVTEQNKRLTAQIDSGQSKLDKRRVILKAQFSKMEQMISQLNSASQGLSGISF